MAKVERCPKCGAMIYDPFFSSVQVHWVNQCVGIAPPAPEPKPVAKAIRIRKRPGSISVRVPCDEIDDLAKYICDQMSLDYHEFKIGAGERMLARQIYCAVRNEQCWKHEAIAERLGRVRTSVIYALSIHNKCLKEDYPQSEFYQHVFSNALNWCQISGKTSSNQT